MIRIVYYWKMGFKNMNLKLRVLECKRMLRVYIYTLLKHWKGSYGGSNSL